MHRGSRGARQNLLKAAPQGGCRAYIPEHERLTMKRFALMGLTVSLLSVAGCTRARAPESRAPAPTTQTDMPMAMQRMDMGQMMEMHSHMMGDSAIVRHMMGDSAMRAIMQEMRGDDMPMSAGAMGGMRGMGGVDAAARKQMMESMQARMNAMTPEHRRAMMARMQDAHMRMMADPDVRTRMMKDPDMRRLMQQMMSTGTRDTSVSVSP